MGLMEMAFEEEEAEAEQTVEAVSLRIGRVEVQTPSVANMIGNDIRRGDVKTIPNSDIIETKQPLPKA